LLIIFVYFEEETNKEEGGKRDGVKAKGAGQSRGKLNKAINVCIQYDMICNQINSMNRFFSWIPHQDGFNPEDK